MASVIRWTGSTACPIGEISIFVEFPSLGSEGEADGTNTNFWYVLFKWSLTVISVNKWCAFSPKSLDSGGITGAWESVTRGCHQEPKTS